MLSDKLKRAWRNTAHNMMVEDFGEICAPALGSTSLVIGRICKAIPELDDSNFEEREIDIRLVCEELIAKGGSPTPRNAKYLMRAHTKLAANRRLFKIGACNHG